MICAGPKAILNIPATLEYLETLGVPVIGYRCDMMPAFWSQSADLRVDYRLDSAAEIAESVYTEMAGGPEWRCAHRKPHSTSQSDRPSND